MRLNISGRAALSRGAALTLLALLLALLAALASPGSPQAAGRARQFLAGPHHVLVRDLPPAPPAQARGDSERVVPRRSAPALFALAGDSSTVPAANAVDSGAAAGAGPTLLANRFEGIDNGDNLSLAGFTLTPPDPQVAAGPNHVLEMTNVVGRIFDKKGAALLSFRLADFFRMASGWYDTDPRVIYDAPTGRYFATYVSFIDNAGSSPDFGRLHVAISQTDDPTGAWDVYYLPYTDVLPDYPGIGVTDDKFTVSTNLYDIDARHVVAPCLPPQGFCGEQTVVIEKSELLAGVAATVFAFPENPGRFTVRPAHSLSATSDQYLATFDLSAGLPSTRLTLIRLTGTPAAGNVVEASAVNLPVLGQSSPPLSRTAGSGTIDSGDFRLLEAAWRDGTLWTAASAACTPPGDGTVRSCAHLIAVDTDAGAVTQDITFGAPNQYYSWPSVRTDAAGNLFVSLTHTNSGIFAEAAATGRLAGDPPGTLGGTTLLRAGDVLHTSTRWGDYLSVAVDPVDPACVWVAGEYAKSTSGPDWGTYLAAGLEQAKDGHLNHARERRSTRSGSRRAPVSRATRSTTICSEKAAVIRLA